MDTTYTVYHIYIDIYEYVFIEICDCVYLSQRGPALCYVVAPLRLGCGVLNRCRLALLSEPQESEAVVGN